jgi:hypothetical protein
LLRFHKNFFEGGTGNTNVYIENYLIVHNRKLNVSMSKLKKIVTFIYQRILNVMNSIVGWFQCIPRSVTSILFSKKAPGLLTIADGGVLGIEYHRGDRVVVIGELLI